MRLRSLSLTQFRSYTECNLPWDNVLHLLLGSNGSGKTNILEAISILSLGRSCLGSEEEDLLGGERNSIVSERKRFRTRVKKRRSRS